jgi:hypothetical protein
MKYTLTEVQPYRVWLKLIELHKATSRLPHLDSNEPREFIKSVKQEYRFGTILTTLSYIRKPELEAYETDDGLIYYPTIYGPFKEDIKRCTIYAAAAAWLRPVDSTWRWEEDYPGQLPSYMSLLHYSLAWTTEDSKAFICAASYLVKELDAECNRAFTFEAELEESELKVLLPITQRRFPHLSDREIITLSKEVLV